MFVFLSSSIPMRCLVQSQIQVLLTSTQDHLLAMVSVIALVLAQLKVLIILLLNSIIAVLEHLKRISHLDLICIVCKLLFVHVLIN